MLADTSMTNTTSTIGGGDNEGSYDGLNEACKQDFRKGASKVLLLITDEPPLDPEVPVLDNPSAKKPPNAPSDFNVKSRKEMLAILKGKGIDQLHLVVRPAHHKYFRPLQDGVRVSQGDKFFDLEKVVKDPSSGDGFARLLPELSKEIARVTVAGGPASPQAQAPPAPSAEGAAVPPSAEVPTRPSLIAEGSFAREDSPRLTLAMAAWSAALAAGVGLLLAAGQNLYSRQTWYVPPDLLKGLGGGAAAGLVGGVVGELLYQFTPAAAAPFFRLVGWASLGGLTGLGLSFFVPNLRAWKGLAGGAAGGLAGGLGYLLVVLVLGGAVNVGARLLGAMLLGLAIGLMVAFAERLFRKAWLEVRYGERETITVNLGPEPVKVGGDARACSVFVRGAAPVALRYWVSEGRVMCEDVPAKQTSEAPPDHPRNVGTLTLTVRSAVVKEQSAAPPRPPAAPPVVKAPPPPPAPPPPVVQAAPPAPAPAPKSAADPDLCPSCGQRVPGPKGRRYCVRCDVQY
jgi:hypothetical protein